ncbi:MAG TPA: hypothetical protein DCR93_34075 [Cytophagales bacterium]|nr:hypothetical protein [Cytophagales bacterium]
MFHKTLRLWAITPLLLLQVFALQAQPKIDTISLQKGQILDLLFLSQNPDIEEARQSYFQVAFPVANRFSYQGLPGFRITDHVQGNHRPSFLILGEWADRGQREAFLEQIVNEVPDFHERRRQIWSYFGLCYFELTEDLSIHIDRGKHHVATAYWFEEGEVPKDLVNRWQEQRTQAGGSTLLQLQDGTSPAGYQYRPDYFVITTWDSEADFQAYQQSVSSQALEEVKHINELILQ